MSVGFVLSARWPGVWVLCVTVNPFIMKWDHRGAVVSVGLWSRYETGWLTPPLQKKREGVEETGRTLRLNQQPLGGQNPGGSDWFSRMTTDLAGENVAERCWAGIVCTGLANEYLLGNVNWYSARRKVQWAPDFSLCLVNHACGNDMGLHTY